MMHIDHVNTLPENGSEFVAEIARGMTDLYGTEVASTYAARAVSDLSQVISHPLVTTVIASDNSGAIGLAMGVNREGIGQISFVHVLARAAGRGVERGLLNRVIDSLQRVGINRIVAEPLCFFEGDIESCFIARGFRRYDRALMTIDPGSIAVPYPDSSNVTVGDIDTVGRVLVDAYRDQPGNELHPETATLSAAAGFVFSALRGAFGPVSTGYGLQLLRNRDPVGIVLGCEEPPGIGFVLHLAVLPEFRHRGIGGGLIRGLASAFHNCGLRRMDLGVTMTNPALRLYERLGFKILRHVPAFVWQREEIDRVYSEVHSLG